MSLSKTPQRSVNIEHGTICGEGTAYGLDNDTIFLPMALTMLGATNLDQGVSLRSGGGHAAGW